MSVEGGDADIFVAGGGGGAGKNFDVVLIPLSLVGHLL